MALTLENGSGRNIEWGKWGRRGAVAAVVGAVAAGAWPLGKEMACDQKCKDESLFRAIGEENVGALRKWLEKGANPNGRDSETGRPMINRAARECNVEIIKELITAGADPKIKDVNDRDALSKVRAVMRSNGEEKKKRCQAAEHYIVSVVGE